MKKRTPFIYAVSLLLPYIVAVAAQSRPNFTGTWKLNVDKSDVEGFSPQSFVLEIVHKEPHVRSIAAITQEGKEAKSEVNFTTDGKDTVNKTPDGEGTDKARWEGNVLVRDTQGKLSNGLSLTQRDKYTLSEDGKTMTIARHYATEISEGNLRFVFEKQPNK